MPDKNRRRTAVNFIIGSRAGRKKYFPEWLFSEPAWDILLALYAARLDEQDVPVPALARSANADVSTVKRWLRALEKEGLVLRQLQSPDDRVSLSEAGWLAMDSYFEGMSSGMI